MPPIEPTVSPYSRMDDRHRNPEERRVGSITPQILPTDLEYAQPDDTHPPCCCEWVTRVIEALAALRKNPR